MRGASKLHLLVPVEVFKDCADIKIALGELRKLKDSTPFKLVVTGVTEEDVELIEGLERAIKRKSVKKAFDLPSNLEVVWITEREIQDRVGEWYLGVYGKDAEKLENRAVIIEDIYREKLGTRDLPEGENMAITIKTDVSTEEEAENLANSEKFKKLKKELSKGNKNISIRLLVKPEEGESVYSLSAIINDWFSDIRNGRKSAIGITLPLAASMIKELEECLRATWLVLAAA